MNAKQLQHADGTKVDAWQCAACGMIYGERKAYSSERCCVCTDCGKQITKDDHGGARATLCRACWVPHYSAIDAARLEKATELLDYAGPVYDGSDYHASIDDMMDALDGSGRDLPEFVHACAIGHYTLNGADVLQNMVENCGPREDFGTEDLDGVKEFEAACDAFNAANAKYEYWEIDYQHKVRVVPVADVAVRP
jgi:hypothetical protein